MESPATAGLWLPRFGGISRPGGASGIVTSPGRRNFLGWRNYGCDGGFFPNSEIKNNLSKIDLTAVGFTPKSSMNPCTDFNGMKANVQYAESTDRTVDGQVFAIELRK